MARHEEDRENLFRDATALVERISVRLPGDDESTVVGFRRDGSTSFYFGPGCVYHFTPDGRLRRAFVDDLLFKAASGRLISLRRQRRPDAVELVRRELDAAQTAAFLARLREALAVLRQTLTAGTATCEGQVPPEADVAGRALAWLEQFAQRVTIAPSPRVG